MSWRVRTRYGRRFGGVLGSAGKPYVAVIYPSAGAHWLSSVGVNLWIAG
jgi:hypothetical protein